MKKFLLFIFTLILSLSLISVDIVFADDLTDDQKIAIALYQEAVREGYTIDVPESLRGNSFYNAMQPLVNIIKGSVQSVNDVFEFVGDTLFYDVNKVKGWLTDIFGSDRENIYNSSLALVPFTYPQLIANVSSYNYLTVNDRQIFLDYPLVFRHPNSDLCSWGIWYRDILKYVPIDYFTLNVSVSSSIGFYSFSSLEPVFFAKGYDISSSIISAFPIDNPAKWSLYSITLPSYSSNSSDFSVSVTNFLSYLCSYTNIPGRINIAGNMYYINGSPLDFSMNYQGNPSTDIDITQSAIQESYFTNNTYNEVTNIYNSTTINNINNGGSGDSDDVIDAINRVDSSVVSGTAAIIDSINNLSFNQESNTEISNNYDFDFGDLNISGAVDIALPSIGEGFDVVTGSAISTIGSIIHIIPSEWLLLAFACLGAGLIISVANKVHGG